MDRFFPLYFLDEERDVAETFDSGFERLGVGTVKPGDLVFFDQDKMMQMLFAKFVQMTKIILVFFFQQRGRETGFGGTCSHDD